ncbi:MAG: hypothetical protein Cons2KO_04540 [Congregibacter sp.]
MKILLAFFLFVGFVAGYLGHGFLNDPQKKPPPRLLKPSIVRDAPSAAVPRPTGSSRSPVSFADLYDQPSIFDTLHTAFQLAADADLESLKTYIGASLAIDDPLFHSNIADVFFERLTALDVAESIALAEDLTSRQHRYQFTTSGVRTWVRTDPDAALAYLDALDDLQLRRMAANAIANDTGLPDTVLQSGQKILAATILELRGSQVLMATSGGAIVSGSRTREDFAAIEQQLRNDPQETMGDLLAMPSTQQRQMLLMYALNKLAVWDLELAMEYLDDYPNELASAKSQVLVIAAQSQPERFRAEIEEHARRTGDGNAMSQLIMSMMKSDRDGALAYYDAQSGDLKRQIGYRLAMQLVQEDPREGLRWVMEQESNESLVAVALQAGNVDVSAEAEALLAELPAGAENRDQLLSAVAAGRARLDPRSALDWLDGFRGEAGYDTAYAQVMHEWAGREPAAAAEQLTLEPIQTDDQGLVSSLTHRWARSDPDAAESWAMDLRDESMRDAALSTLVGVYAQTDVDRARALYFRLPAGPGRDRAGVSLAMQTAGQDRSKWRSAMQELGIAEDVIDSYITVWSN